jgi:8-amino-7-oxononanoate synthase
VLGAGPSETHPYGRRGGGTVRHLGVGGPEVVIVCSLAKAFGAPLACLSGSRAVVDRIAAESETRTHASPPSLADLHAAESALRANASSGEELRRRLVALVRSFRSGVRGLGMSLVRTLLPIQTLGPMSRRRARATTQALLKRGIKAAPVGTHRGAGIVFLLRADMTETHIDRTIHALRLPAPVPSLATGVVP